MHRLVRFFACLLAVSAGLACGERVRIPAEDLESAFTIKPYGLCGASYESDANGLRVHWLRQGGALLLKEVQGDFAHLTLVAAQQEPDGLWYYDTDELSRHMIGIDQVISSFKVTESGWQIHSSGILSDSTDSFLKSYVLQRQTATSQPILDPTWPACYAEKLAALSVSIAIDPDLVRGFENNGQLPSYQWRAEEDGLEFGNFLAKSAFLPDNAGNRRKAVFQALDRYLAGGVTAEELLLDTLATLKERLHQKDCAADDYHDMYQFYLSILDSLAKDIQRVPHLCPLLFADATFLSGRQLLEVVPRCFDISCRNSSEPAPTNHCRTIFDLREKALNVYLEGEGSSTELIIKMMLEHLSLSPTLLNRQGQLACMTALVRVPDRTSKEQWLQIKEATLAFSKRHTDRDSSLHGSYLTSLLERVLLQ